MFGEGFRGLLQRARGLLGGGRREAGSEGQLSVAELRVRAVKGLDGEQVSAASASGDAEDSAAPGGAGLDAGLDAGRDAGPSAATPAAARQPDAYGEFEVEEALPYDNEFDEEEEEEEEDHDDDPLHDPVDELDQEDEEEEEEGNATYRAADLGRLITRGRKTPEDAIAQGLALDEAKTGLLNDLVETLPLVEFARYPKDLARDMAEDALRELMHYNEMPLNAEEEQRLGESILGEFMQMCAKVAAWDRESGG